MKPTQFLILLVLATFLFATATPATAETVTMLAGVRDDFDASNGPELASPSPALRESLDLTSTLVDDDIRDFDDAAEPPALDSNSPRSINLQFGHTFDLSGLPKILGATLQIRIDHLAGTGSPFGLESTDFIALGFFDGNPVAPSDRVHPDVAWVRALTDNDAILVNDPGLAGDDGFVFSTVARQRQSYTLDLSELPLANGGTLNLVSALNANGFLDVAVQDDSRVDFVELQLNVVPEPGTMVILIIVGLASLGRRGRAPTMAKIA